MMLAGFENSVMVIMADIASLTVVLMRQHKEQMDEQGRQPGEEARQYREQKDELAKQKYREQMDKMKDELEAACDGARGSYTPMTSFQPFDSSSYTCSKFNPQGEGSISVSYQTV